MILLLGPAEEDCQSFFLEAIGEDNINIIFYPDKKELLSILSMAGIYIGHDSGVTHLAAMLGAPVIALFKDDSSDQWSPIGPSVKIMRNRESEHVFIGKIVEAVREILLK